VVIAELASLRREAQICYIGDLDVWNVETLYPLVFLLILELQDQVLILEVCELCFCRNVLVTDAACLKASVVSLL
jgi:hypothetical protein